jgi:hypothetical protein
MAVAPKGVAQNLVSVFMEMVRFASYSFSLYVLLVVSLRCLRGCDAAQRGGRSARCAHALRFCDACFLRVLCVFALTLLPFAPVLFVVRQWADPRKSGAFYAGLTPTLAGIIPYSARFAYYYYSSAYLT